MEPLPMVIVKDGVLLRVTNIEVIPATEADRIARANGFAYAEHFVKANMGKVLQIDENWQAHLLNDKGRN